ncbi:BTB/POZ domain-containing protein [Acorus gramineus]|uniref:BTB/POZ domain-containing protein n=1 Tax=Acorus gramineus TaxID=55184 RepID=A0AAV9AYZ7_ACOGR|nr:BTB/POZ domain-containing protein [Acorus gramineus]
MALSFSSSLNGSTIPNDTSLNVGTRATGIQPDIIIHVQDQSFHLHKDPLLSRIGYLRRHDNSAAAAVTLSPPLHITAATFAAVATSCYGHAVPLSPSNLAPLRVAADVLDISGDGDGGEDDLRRRTEAYFTNVVSGDRDAADHVLRSCLRLLPNAEAAGSLASRCVESMATMDGLDGRSGWIDCVCALSAEDFQIIADSLRARSARSLDLLYRIADLYLKEHPGKLTEEEKNRICSTVDCRRLSPQLLIHAVQNPRMPLRFVVRAMLIEQLHTRRSIFGRHHHHRKPPLPAEAVEVDPTQDNTLGAILQRDAALRQVIHLRASMEAMCAKVETLEGDLAEMRLRLRRSMEEREQQENRVIVAETESVRSASFRFASDKGSARRMEAERERSWASSERSNRERSIGRAFLEGIKSVFRMSRSEGHGGGPEITAVGGDNLQSRGHHHHRRVGSFS